MKTWDNKAYDYAMYMLQSAGFQAFAVGGCVRDMLLGLTPRDIDIATSARPENISRVFEKATSEDTALYPTGTAHGTWTFRKGNDTVEITTFRRDVSCDGRRATVEYTDSLKEDAQRRDFTINALYYNNRKGVIDPTGMGMTDLQKGIVRFVGDADLRIQEDYLRILRLFRFHARFGRGNPMDADAREAAQRHAGAILDHVSGERVWDELKKILSLYSPAEALWEMHATKVLKHVLGVERMLHIGGLFMNERIAGVSPSWVHRYECIKGDGEIPFPCSREDQRRVEAAHAAFVTAITHVWGLGAIAHKHGAEAAIYVALMGMRQYDHDEIKLGVSAQMPVTAQDLIERGIQPGPRLGKALAAALDFWYVLDLNASKEKLLREALFEVRNG